MIVVKTRQHQHEEVVAAQAKIWQNTMCELQQNEMNDYVNKFQVTLRDAEHIAEAENMTSKAAITQLAALMSAEHKDQLANVDREHSAHMQSIVQHMSAAETAECARMHAHCEGKIYAENELATRNLQSAASTLNSETDANKTWAEQWQVEALKYEAYLHQVEG